MSEMTWERLGDDFTFVWSSEQLAVTASSIRENRDHDMVATITPEQVEGDRLQPLMAPTKVNLSSAAGKASAVKALQLRRGFAAGGLNWGDIIETVATVVQREWKAGSPWSDLSEVTWEERVDWLLEPFLPRNEVVVVYGDGESGKSMWAAYLAYCVRAGIQPAHGRHAPKPCRVLYLDYETHNESGQARRFGRISRGLGAEALPNGIWRRQCFRPITEESSMLAAKIAQRKVGLVILDSLAWAAGGDINEAGVAIPTMNAIRQLGCTVIVIAHIPKGEREHNGRRSIAGSVFFENAPRLTWEVRSSKDEEGLVQAIYQRKTNDFESLLKPLGQRVAFPKEEGSPIRVSESTLSVKSDVASGTPLKQRIRELLLASREPRTVADISDELGAKDSVVRTTLARMDGVRYFDEPGGRVRRWAMKAPVSPGMPSSAPEPPCPECSSTPWSYGASGEPLCFRHSPASTKASAS